MGNLVFQATLGGQVNLVGPNTASTYNINVPAVNGNMVTTGDTGTVSSTMLASSLSLTTPNIGVATGTSLKVSAGLYSTSSSSFTYTDGIVMDYTTGLGRISVGTSDGFAFYNAGVATTELMRLDSSGNLGLGVTSSAWTDTKSMQLGQAASVFGGSSQIGAYVGSNVYYGSGWKYITTGYATKYEQNESNSGAHKWWIAGTGTAGNAITFTQAMTLDASGNLLVGTTSTVGASNPGASFSPSTGGRTILALGSNNTGAGYELIQFYNPNGKVGRIETSGSATAYVTSSDYRLKENIAPMTNALSVVSALKPCTYTWKTDGSAGQGFIAHELQSVVPDCVSGEKDAVDENGNPVYQGIDTSFLVATLTAAIQEQQDLITQLQADVAALKAPQ